MAVSEKRTRIRIYVCIYMSMIYRSVYAFVDRCTYKSFILQGNVFILNPHRRALHHNHKGEKEESQSDKGREI